MIDLEDRVGAALHTAAETVTHPPLDLSRPQTLTRRRRRNRRIGRAVAALLTLVGLGAVFQLAAGDSLTVQTADQDGLDEQGLPVDTGPELDWTRVDDATDLELRDVVWSGERYLALGGEDRGTLYASSDGRQWEPAPNGMPDDFTLGVITASDGQVIVWGWEGDSANHGSPQSDPPTVLVSDDHGANWRNLGSFSDPPVDDDPTDFVTPSSYVATVAVGENTTMLLEVSYVWPSLEEALADRGLLQPGDEVTRVEEEWRSSTGRVSAKYCLNAPDQGCGDDVESIEFVTRLPEDQQLNDPSTTTVWTSTDGGPFEPVSELASEVGELVAVQGRFFTVLWDDATQLLVSDDDGLTWNPVALDQSASATTASDQGTAPSGTAPLELGTDGTDLVVTTNIDGQKEFRRSSDGGRTWTTTKLAADTQNIAVGPGGQVLTAWVYPEDQGPVRSFLNWVAELRGADSTPPAVIGWSADGVSWGWQSRADVFGTKGWTEVAVGRTTAVAVVFPELEDGQVGLTKPSLFVAEIPS